jgi:glycosyltransferase involved in cell wall biosynthesis
MKILQVSEAFGGGLIEMVVALSEGLAERGHDVSIAYGRRPETPADVRSVVDRRVALHPLPWGTRRPHGELRAGLQLRRLVREQAPDVVHLHSSFAGVTGALAVGRAAQSVFTPHAYASEVPEGNFTARLAYRVAERFASRRATLVGAVSEAEARVARVLGAQRVEVVPNGVRELDPGRHVTRNGNRSCRVIAMGRTVPQRRPAETARILSAVRDVAEVAWIGGGGGDRGDDGREALLAAGIEATGWQPREQVLDELADALVCLHWTAWDGLPLSVLEAMSRDTLVVASDIGPSREVLDPRQLCRSEEEAVALIRRVVSDEDFGRELLEAQRARRERFGAQRMVDDWLHLYERLAS